MIRILKSRQGNLLLWGILFSFILSIGMLVVPRMLVRSKKLVLDEHQRFEAYLLASDLVEIGRYLVFYEKVFYRRDTLGLRRPGSNGAATRGECLRTLWGQPLAFPGPGGLGTMLNACGTNTPIGWLGNMAVECGGADPATFCPFVIRSPSMGGDSVEQGLYDPLAAVGAMAPVGPGHYRLELDLSTAFNPATARQNELMFPTFRGQQVLRDNFNSIALGRFFGAQNLSARLIIEFFSPSSSFSSVSSERYVKITGRISLTGRGNVEHVVEKAQTVMMALSTPKDFALFMPFPDRGTLPMNTPPGTNWKLDNAPTNLWSLSTNIPTPATVNFQGRVFFAGNMDVATVGALPTFRESVVIGGDLTVGGAIPGPAALGLLRTKFQKGIVTNFSPERFVLSGPCAPNGPIATFNYATNVNIANLTKLYCEHPDPGTTRLASNIEYITGADAEKCWNTRATVQDASVALSLWRPPSCPNTVVTAACNPPVIAINQPTCVNVGGFWKQGAFQFLTGGFREVVASSVGSYAAVMTPSVRFTANAGAQVYGLVMTGYLDVLAGATFTPIGALRSGMPGINEVFLGFMNAQAAAANALVGIGLLNFPVVMVTGDEGG